MLHRIDNIESACGQNTQKSKEEKAEILKKVREIFSHIVTRTEELGLCDSDEVEVNKKHLFKIEKDERFYPFKPSVFDLSHYLTVIEKDLGLEPRHFFVLPYD